jgi:hypothetical protein
MILTINHGTSTGFRWTLNPNPDNIKIMGDDEEGPGLIGGAGHAKWIARPDAHSRFLYWVKLRSHAGGRLGTEPENSSVMLLPFRIKIPMGARVLFLS